VIVGGVGLSTLLTTLVVPALYLLIGAYTRPANYTAQLLERMRERENEKARAGAHTPHPAE
jgi:multidrug efflux pump